MSIMPLPALAIAADTGGTPGSPSRSSALSISAALSFNGQPVYVTTGNLLAGGGFSMSFSLTNPVVVGDLTEFIEWAGKQFGVDIDQADIDGVIDKVPLEWLQTELRKVLVAQLVLTILNVSIQPNVPTYVQVGATINFIEPIGPSWFNLTQLGFTFTKGQSAASPA